MRRTPVSSSTLRSVGYSPRSATLEVEFTSGDVYRYFDVPIEVFDSLMSAGSLGRYFNARIRDRYRFAKR